MNTSRNHNWPAADSKRLRAAPEEVVTLPAVHTYWLARRKTVLFFAVHRSSPRPAKISQSPTGQPTHVFPTPVHVPAIPNTG